jgi:hypothetical protein
MAEHPEFLILVKGSNGRDLDGMASLSLPAVPRIGDKLLVNWRMYQVTTLIWRLHMGPPVMWVQEVPAKETCPNCESDQLSWMPMLRAIQGIATNRLGLGDVLSDFALGCDECSETVRIVSGDAVAAALTKSGVNVQEVQ